MRNLFERAVSAQANRLAALQSVTREQLMRLTSDDIRTATGQEDAAEPSAVTTPKPGDDARPCAETSGDAQQKTADSDGLEAAETPDGGTPSDATEAAVPDR